MKEVRGTAQSKDGELVDVLTTISVVSMRFARIIVMLAEVTTMTEIQTLMIYICFGAMIGVIVTEFIFVIATFMGWVRSKVRKHKDAKKFKNTATKVE